MGKKGEGIRGTRGGRGDGTNLNEGAAGEGEEEAPKGEEGSDSLWILYREKIKNWKCFQPSFQADVKRKKQGEGKTTKSGRTQKGEKKKGNKGRGMRPEEYEWW